MNGAPPTDPPESERERWWWSLDPRRSLPIRMALAAGVTAVIFTLLIGGIAGKVFRRQLEAQLGASFENLAHQVADKLDRNFYERYREILLTGSSAPLGNPATPVAERRRLLESLLNSSPDYAWLGFANPAGTIVFATKGQLEGTKVGDEPWFANGRGKPYIGDAHEVPELAREMGAPANASVRFLDFAMPVVSATGQFLGVLDARVAWALAQEVQASIIPETAQRDHIDLTLYSSNGEVLLDSGGYGWSEPPLPVLPERQKSRGFFRETIPNEGTYVTGYARSYGYREFRSQGWLVVIRQAAANAFAPAAELERIVTQVGFAFTALAVVLAWFFGSHLAQRLRAVGAAAQRAGAGDILTLMPQSGRRDEIQTLCTSLDVMVDKFRRQQEALETEKTRLEARLQEQAKSPRL